MDARGIELRQRIAAVQQVAPERRRYGPALKRAIAEYGLAQRDAGLTVAQIAESLGLSRTILSRWLRHAERRLAIGRTPVERPGRAPRPVAAAQPTRPAEPAAAPPRPALPPTDDTTPILIVHVHQLQVEMDAVSRRMVLAMLGETETPEPRS